MNFDEVIKSYLDNGKDFSDLANDLGAFRDYVLQKEKETRFVAAKNWVHANHTSLIKAFEVGAIELRSWGGENVDINEEYFQESDGHLILCLDRIYD